MDDIQGEAIKARAKSKSLESQLEQLKQREAEIIARRQALEAKVAKKKRTQRTRAFVCMGALMDRLIREDDALRQHLLHEAAKENIHNRVGLGGYWADFMPAEEEIRSARKSRKEKPELSDGQ